jgi:molybdate transport system substrate-binding protein
MIMYTLSKRIEFRTAVLFTLSLLLLAACAPQQGAASQTLTVLAAASLMEPFNELGALFERQQPGVRVVFQYAGSQQLAQQIDQGAPADVFASASQRHMDAASASGRVDRDEVEILGDNRLVVIYPAGSSPGLSELADLARPALKLILASSEVPVGQYSLDFLDKASQHPAFSPSFRAGVLQNVVSYENNVKAVVTKVSLGEADAGIVYASDLTGAAAQKLGQLEIPPDLNVRAAYPIAVLTDSPNPALAQAFVALVLSPEGQEILARFGFLPHAP